ncbi:hypothetical protein TUBRATIS_007070 [Tubulinosema ratisbonensis]|uniref:Uncharacterized protein n=1 Tax=Tubulinosema ratisbonensis TaxID=291195 RepID=A0A437ANU5_9MICR|nr:hypothetical protein TUBRATIS_007070 [Tubulinosema ratisbonensis]
MNCDSHLSANLILFFQQIIFVIMYLAKEHYVPELSFSFSGLFTQIKEGNLEIVGMIITQFFLFELLLMILSRIKKSELFNKIVSTIICGISISICVFTIKKVLQIQNSTLFNVASYCIGFNMKDKYSFHLVNGILDYLAFIFYSTLNLANKNTIFISYGVINLLSFIFMSMYYQFSDLFILLFTTVKLIYYKLCYFLNNGWFFIFMYSVILVQFFVLIYFLQYFSHLYEKIDSNYFVGYLKYFYKPQ